MSFLFPLYALAALAIGGPILFHLFQRRPHGKQDFSSVMFLRSTPPKLTRRSRLSDLLLLLLRGLALLLLAAAFARPFLRSTTLLDLDAPSRSVALVVDTSASLRREALWDQVQQELADVVGDLQPTDQVCLVSFDREVTVHLSFAAWQEADPARRLGVLRDQIRSLSPTWYQTDLAAAMMAASDALLQQRLAEDLSQPLQVILFSDLQVGSDLTALQSYEWPEEISVDVRTVAAQKPTNASLVGLPPVASEMDATQVRVMVRNAADSGRAQFQLRWDADPTGRQVEVHVPPGQSRVVRMTQPRGGKQLRLAGDDTPFDNELFVTETRPQQKTLWYVGSDDADDTESLVYYLQRASLSTRTCDVTVKQVEDLTALATLMPEQTPLLVLSRALDTGMQGHLRSYLQAGGRVLFVATSKELGAANSFLQWLLEEPTVRLAKVAPSDYAMLSSIDFEHPLFQPFADPRFSDFTKIRFWSYQELSSSHEDAWQTLARFDSGSPALVEKRVGAGVVWVLTSGWQPAESQLARSSKFIPLLHGMFGQTERAADQPRYEVGSSFPITPHNAPTVVTTPEGTTVTLPAEATQFDAVEVAGIYQVEQLGKIHSVAVNLPAAESQTAPMTPDQIEQLGVRLGTARSIESIKKEQRQMRNKELEGRQKLWRLGILAALIAVALETGLGMRRSRPALGQE